MPDADNIGVSRKIEDKAERDRLKKIADKIKPSGFGFIVRTEAEGKSDKDLASDLEFLLRMWNEVQEKAKKLSAPAIVHQDLSLIYKTIRDVFGSDVHKMFIDSQAEYKKALDLCRLMSPRLKSRIALYDDPEPIFEHFSIKNELEQAAEAQGMAEVRRSSDDRSYGSFDDHRREYPASSSGAPASLTRS